MKTGGSEEDKLRYENRKYQACETICEKEGTGWKKLVS